MRIRVLLLALVVLTVTPTAFAFCQYCNWDSRCIYDPGSGTYCDQYIDFCLDFGGCPDFAPNTDAPSVASQYTLASVEIETPDGTRVAEVAATPVVATAELQPQK